MGAPYCSSARSTISIARSTPAQKPRGLASRTSMAAGIFSRRGPPRRPPAALITHQAIQDKQHRPDRDRGIRDVERWPVPGERMKVEEVDDVAEAQPVDRLAERSAEDRRERAAEQRLAGVTHD